MRERVEEPLSEPVDYGRMISRHMDRLLSIFPSEKLDRVLRLSELTLGERGVVDSAEGPASAEAAFRYKAALREVFGEGVFAMARVNFIQSGCRCRHCREESK
jgi:hypothetical protein